MTSLGLAVGLQDLSRVLLHHDVLGVEYKTLAALRAIPEGERNDILVRQVVGRLPFDTGQVNPVLGRWPQSQPQPVRRSNPYDDQA
ncbi:hypothetical protein [Micromonospora kangleipakensis]|uniref:hypothetical protein n=1 Tax=Micromonospora kangleipakensis TaxID=1077942 RepID=UPI001029A76C|nr:hypothetical protein [Micromonospora kangleipakensis]